jgi:hypothetical protein
MIFFNALTHPKQFETALTYIAKSLVLPTTVRFFSIYFKNDQGAFNPKMAPHLDERVPFNKFKEDNRPTPRRLSQLIAESHLRTLSYKK